MLIRYGVDADIMLYSAVSKGSSNCAPEMLYDTTPATQIKLVASLIVTVMEIAHAYVAASTAPFGQEVSYYILKSIEATGGNCTIL